MSALLFEMNLAHPVLIIGQGLAGTALAWRLHERGVPFVIVDPNEAGTCSKVAAGLVTPITGRRVKPTWRVDELLPVAMEFYRQLEKMFGVKLFHPLPLVRLFNEPREVEWWRGRAGESGIHQWIDEEASLVSEAEFNAEFGGIVQRHAGWLDTQIYLRISLEHFVREARVVQDSIRDDEIEEGEGCMRWRGESFSTVVFCRGGEERLATRFFPWLRFDCARGVITTLRAGLSERRMVNRGGWIIPRGDGTWRAGATYEFDLRTPMETSVADLRAKLSRLLRVPFEIDDAQAGVRPIIKHRQLVLGRHPAHPRVAVFNGLGSKGVLRAPFFARMLAEHFLNDTAVETMVDVQAND